MLSLLAAPVLRLAAQQNTTFSTDVKVVNVLATVRTKKGEIVHTLQREDFSLEEDGKPQSIQYFAQEANLPLTLGLLVDTSGSQRRVLGQERTASYKFFQQVLREDKDLAFVIHFDQEVELLQDLTASRQKLEKALDLLQVNQPQMQRRNGGGTGGGGGYPGGGGGYPGGGSGRGRGGTALYDSIELAADEMLKKQAGRKAVVLLTDGVDNGSKLTLPSAIEAAQRNDTLVYSILFAGIEPVRAPMGGYGGRRGGRRMPMPPPQAGQRADGKKVLQRLAKETGGGFFEVTKKMPLDKIYDRIQEELRNQYNLGFTPNRTDSGGGYRKLHVATRDKTLIVQARDGYYPR
jgi:VWFA-related protein